jgi:hypothetical protein
MLTTESLANAGFRFHPYLASDTRSSYKKGLWQKRIATDKNEALYAICIEEHRPILDITGLDPNHLAATASRRSSTPPRD